jgi:hypothetical protein
MARKSSRELVLLCGVLVSMFATTLPAQTNWVGTTGDWFEPTNWSTGSVPTVQAAVIDNGGTAQIMSGSASAQTLTLGNAASGTLSQTGGTLNTDGLSLGTLAGASGSYTLTTGTLKGRLGSTVGTMTVGDSGSGTFTQSGGSVSAGTLQIALRPGSSGSFTMSGGVANSSSQVDVASGGTGSFNQSNGQFTGATEFFGSNGHAATAVLGGGTHSFSQGLTIGNLVSSFSHTGGMLTGTTGSNFTNRGLFSNTGGTTTLYNWSSFGSPPSSSPVTVVGAPIAVTGSTCSVTGSLTFDLDPTLATPTITTSAGSATFAGTLAIDLADGTAGLISPSATFNLFVDNNTSFAPGVAFGNVANGARINFDEGSFVVNYGATSPFGANKVVLSNFQPAPEPSAAVGAVLAGAVALLRRRRR